MVQSPSWEANWFAASQEIPRILWNPKVHYRTHKPKPPVPMKYYKNTKIGSKHKKTTLPTSWFTVEMEANKSRILILCLGHVILWNIAKYCALNVMRRGLV
jgi:hypothetical protein